MPTVVPLMTAGAAVGMCLSAAPRVVRIPLLVGVMALATFELTKEGSEAFNAAAIFGGQGEQGAAQMIDPKKVEADDAAGREISAAKRTITAQWQGLSGDALLKQSQGVAAAESERELLAKRAKGIKLTSMESLRLSELKKARADAETAESQSTSARAEAKMNREAAELNARLIESLQRGNGDLLYTFYDMFIPKGMGLGK